GFTFSTTLGYAALALVRRCATRRTRAARHASKVALAGGIAPALALSLLPPDAASAFSPNGSEFQVNTYTTNHEGGPSVASDSAGDFLVVWQSNGGVGNDTDHGSVEGQVYNASGSPVGGEFQVNTYTTSVQRDSAVAGDSNGNFVVVWASRGSVS